MRTFHKTIFSNAVAIDGHAGAGTACSTENLLDNAIDKAIDIISGHHLTHTRLLSVTHSPIIMGNTTYLIITVVAEEVKVSDAKTGATPAWRHNRNYGT